MTRKKGKLGNFVRSRREKYRHNPRILFHISIAPRKVLQPRRTTYYEAFLDGERWEPMLFLCRFKEIKDWMFWVTSKYHGKKHRDAWRTLEHGGHVVLYVHVVRVHPDELVILNNRYCNEYVIKRAIRPRAIVPIRYSLYEHLDLARVAAAAERAKHHGI